MESAKGLLDKEIGTAKDNLKAPIHNWYKFTAGFSYKLINELYSNEYMNNNSYIYEPFAGCGTTLVEAQKQQIRAVGNEGQSFMHNIIQAKLNWKIDQQRLEKHINNIEIILSTKMINYDLADVHPLLTTLYTPENLNILYTIKHYVQQNIREIEDYLFLNLALSQLLHKCSIHPISVPYISRNKFLKNTNLAIEIFKDNVKRMISEATHLSNLSDTSKIYLHDSREINNNIKTDECDVCITSPPYLNNLDYGEVSKVHSHFFNMTTSWNDITQKVRKKLVTASTTHYGEKAFSLEFWKEQEFYQENKHVADKIVTLSEYIRTQKKTKNGGKSFDILILLYFQDMYLVLKEMRRVLKSSGKAFIVLGDSAPYGVFVPTTDILGAISQNVGFSEFKKYKIRDRGSKWKSLTFRHSENLDENILLLN